MCARATPAAVASEPDVYPGHRVRRRRTLLFLLLALYAEAPRARPKGRTCRQRGSAAGAGFLKNPFSLCAFSAPLLVYLFCENFPFDNLRFVKRMGF